MSETSQRELGDSDSPIEDELEAAFGRMVDEGTQRLHRTWREVLVTGFFGGTEVAVGVLAYLSVLAATQNKLLAGLAFSIGFLSLLLGRSELFTEGFLVPVTTVAAKRASSRQLLKLWSGTLIANLGFDKVVTPKPTFIGDTLTCHTEVVEMRESKSRPNQGILAFKHELTNQRGEIVLSMLRTVLLKKKGA